MRNGGLRIEAVQKKWSGFSELADLFKRSKNIGIELAEIESAIFYVRAAKKARQFFFYLFQMLFTALLLIVGIILLEVGAVLLLPLSTKTQLILMVSFGVLDVLCAFGFLYYLFSAQRWLRDALRENGVLEKWLKTKLA